MNSNENENQNTKETALATSVFTPSHAPVVNDFISAVAGLLKEHLEVKEYAARTNQWSKTDEEAATFTTGKVKITISVERSK